VTERCSDLQYPQRELRRRWGSAVRTGVIGIVAAAGTAMIVAPAGTAMIGPCPQPCLPRLGPSVSAATFSGGQLHETLTFHKAGIFVAHILLSPPSHPTGSPLRGRTVALGQHAAGTAHVSFRVGTLTPGWNAVVIAPQPEAVTKNPKLAATWVYLFARNNGKITKIDLINLKGLMWVHSPS
jgi:hypothetical protein